MLRDTKDDSNKQTCTCRRCTNGWFSPRMHYRLRYEADVECELMKSWLQSPLKDELDYAPGVEYLRGLIQERRIKQQVYVGYKTIVEAILTVLENRCEAGVPSIDSVTAAVAQAGSIDSTAEFFAEGGTVQIALEFIVYAAMDSSPLGDGSWDADRELEAQENGGTDEYWNLPVCANDLDWQLVADKLGISTPCDMTIRTRGGTNNGKRD